jgi:hypothetical protein
MALSPTKGSSVAKENLRDIIAASATFQAWTGAANAAAAEAFIFTSGYKEPEVASMPVRASIFHKEYMWHNVAAATHDDSGILEAWFEGTIPVTYKDTEMNARLWFEENVSGVIEDIKALNGTGSYTLYNHFGYKIGEGEAGRVRDGSAEKTDKGDEIMYIATFAWGRDQR